MNLNAKAHYESLLGHVYSEAVEQHEFPGAPGQTEVLSLI